MRHVAWIALACASHFLSAAERPEVRTGLVVSVVISQAAATSFIHMVMLAAR